MMCVFFFLNKAFPDIFIPKIYGISRLDTSDTHPLPVAAGWFGPFFHVGSQRMPRWSDAPMLRSHAQSKFFQAGAQDFGRRKWWTCQLILDVLDVCIHIYINTYNYTLYCIYIYVYLRIPVSWRNLSFSVLTWHVVMWQVLMNVVASEIKVGFGSPSKSMDPLGTSRHCIDRSPGWKLWLGSIIIHYNPLLLVLLVTIGITSTIMNT